MNEKKIDCIFTIFGTIVFFFAGCFYILCNIFVCKVKKKLTKNFNGAGIYMTFDQAMRLALI